MPAIGALRESIELIGLGRVDDDAGGWTRDDSVSAVVSGQVKPASWSQQQRAERLEMRVSHVVTIRFDPDLADLVKSDSRLRFTDRAGRVRNLSVKTIIDPDEDARWLELGCVEGGPV
jgi:head-tail adaptor